MPAPNGATHALEERIWRKPDVVLKHGVLYHVREYDTVNGQCISKLWNCTKAMVEDARRTARGKVFVYQQRGVY